MGDAARILAVEAYHGGIIRDELYQNIDTVTPYNITVADLIGAISSLRAQVGGGSDEVSFLFPAGSGPVNCTSMPECQCLMCARFRVCVRAASGGHSMH